MLQRVDGKGVGVVGLVHVLTKAPLGTRFAFSQPSGVLTPTVYNKMKKEGKVISLIPSTVQSISHLQ